MTDRPSPGPGDYPEDFPHENGSYWNDCRVCGKRFVGHKRRFICKECRVPREVISHKLAGLNEAIKIEALDGPGPGGANHQYRLTHPGPVGPINPNGDPSYSEICFQNGPIGEAGVNGLSNEALIAVVIDRLQCFQKGPYSCRENAIALTKLEESMHWLQHRTRERLARGVEGTTAK